MLPIKTFGEYGTYFHSMHTPRPTGSVCTNIMKICVRIHLKS